MRFPWLTTARGSPGSNDSEGGPDTTRVAGLQDESCQTECHKPCKSLVPSKPAPIRAAKKPCSVPLLSTTKLTAPLRPIWSGHAMIGVLKVRPPSLDNWNHIVGDTFPSTPLLKKRMTWPLYSKTDGVAKPKPT